MAIKGAYIIDCDPLAELPEGVRVTHEVYQYTPGKFTPVVRVTQDGRVRVRQS